MKNHYGINLQFFVRESGCNPLRFLDLPPEVQKGAIKKLIELDDGLQDEIFPGADFFTASGLDNYKKAWLLCTQGAVMLLAGKVGEKLIDGVEASEIEDALGCEMLDRICLKKTYGLTRLYGLSRLEMIMHQPMAFAQIIENEAYKYAAALAERQYEDADGMMRLGGCHN